MMSENHLLRSINIQKAVIILDKLNANDKTINIVYSKKYRK
jgi:hypothetical protein